MGGALRKTRRPAPNSHVAANMRHFESVVVAAARSPSPGGLGSRATGGGDFYDLQPFPTVRYAFVASTVLALSLLLSTPWAASLLSRHRWGPRVLWVAAFLLNLVTVSQPDRFDGNAAAASTASTKGGKPARAVKTDVPKYQGGIPWTPVFAPAGWAFAIWGAIYLGEMLVTAYVAVLDLPEPMRAFKAPLRPEALALWWAAGNALQSLWCLAFRPQFSNHLYVPAALLGGAAACVLMAHNVLTRWIGADSSLLGKAGLIAFRLPLGLHAGWLSAACLLNFNSWAARSRLALSKQHALATLSAYAAAALGAATTLRSADPTLALVAAWALSAVAAQTGKPETAKSLGLGAVAGESLAVTERGLVWALLLLAAGVAARGGLQWAKGGW